MSAVEACLTCGGAVGTCACQASGLELDLDRGRPPPVSKPGAAPSNAALAVPVPVRGPRPPLAPINTGGTISSGTAKLVVGALLVALFGAGLYFGVQKFRAWGENAVDEAATRPYPATNGLVIAAVTKDYSSEMLPDGAILLRHMPVGSAAGLAGWYGTSTAHGPNLVDDALATMKEQPTYRRLEVAPEPCRGDADPDSAVTTLGELSFGDDKDVTLWTCTLTKKGSAYFLAWAARSSDVDTDKRRLMSMLKGSQLVSNKLCAANVINGGCNPSAPRIVAALITNARR